jgi:Nucleotidyl transferase AbiEii toxin, Type IV TA system
MENDKFITVPPKLEFLEAICWQIADVNQLEPSEMLSRYERGWHYRGVLGEPNPEELLWIEELSQRYGSWLAANLNLQPMESLTNCQQIMKREIHQKILIILSNLNVEFLSECRAYFGGGTLISLQHEEYRESKDIDFICPVGEGYRLLRQQIANIGYDVIFNTQQGIDVPREIRADQYGIRFPVNVDGTTIKFEIISEGRIQLGEPDYFHWSSIPCLNPTDCCAEKLLANADRWPDASVESRDLIDLAILRLAESFPQAAIDKAESAYPVIEPLKKAIQYFDRRSEYRDKCFSSLKIQSPEKIISGLNLLSADLHLDR